MCIAEEPDEATSLMSGSERGGAREGISLLDRSRRSPFSAIQRSARRSN